MLYKRAESVKDYIYTSVLYTEYTVPQSSNQIFLMTQIWRFNKSGIDASSV